MTTNYKVRIVTNENIKLKLKSLNLIDRKRNEKKSMYNYKKIMK